MTKKKQKRTCDICGRYRANQLFQGNEQASAINGEVRRVRRYRMPVGIS